MIAVCRSVTEHTLLFPSNGLFTISLTELFVHDTLCNIWPQAHDRLYYSFFLQRRARLRHSKSSVVCLSRCLSACPWRSVRSLCFHTGWNNSKIISRLISLRFQLGLTPTWAIWSNGNTPGMPDGCSCNNLTRDTLHAKVAFSYRRDLAGSYASVSQCDGNTLIYCE